MNLLTPDGKQIEILLSFDDGRKEDMHLADLLREYSLPAIFYIPSRKRELTNDQLLDLAQDFTIGGHTENHMILNTIPHPDIECEIRDGKSGLEEIIKKKITTFCYPRGRYNDYIKQEVRDAGFTEARTTQVLHTKRGFDPYELHTTIHAYNRKEYDGRPWLSMALEYFDKVLDGSNEDNYYHFWGHSWEIEKYKDWKDLEFLFSYMSKKLTVNHEDL